MSPHNGDSAPAQTTTRRYSRELVASVVGPVALLEGAGMNELIGYITGVDPAVFVGCHRPHLVLWLKAADWLIELYPGLAAMRRAPHDLPGATAYLATLDLPAQFDVPRHPEAGPWLPAEKALEEPASGAS